MTKFFRAGIGLLLYLLVFVLLVDPADTIFRLKIPLFISILLIWIAEKLLLNRIRVRIRSIVFVSVYLIIPIMGIFGAFLQNNLDDPAFAFGFIKSILILMLLFVVDDHDIPLDRILIHTSIILPLLTIPIYIVFLTNTLYFNRIISPYLGQEAGTAFFALRNYYGFQVPMFFFKTSPLLVFPLGYYTNQLIKGKSTFRYLILVLLFLGTMILSGTRANMLAAIFIVIVIVFRHFLMLANKLPLMIASSVLLYLSVLFVSKASFGDREVSQQVKSEHVDAYQTLFDQHPEYMLWGQGLGSTFYSKGFIAFVPQTELTYFDIVRMFGLPLGCLFILFTFIPFFSLINIYRNNREAFYSIIIYFAYLFIAGTNPLLISSTGMLALLAIFSTVNRFKRESHQPAVN